MMMATSNFTGGGNWREIGHQVERCLLLCLYVHLCNILLTFRKITIIQCIKLTAHITITHVVTLSFQFLGAPFRNFVSIIQSKSLFCVLLSCVLDYFNLLHNMQICFFSLQVYISKRYSILSVSISTVLLLSNMVFFQPFFHHVLGWVTIHNNIPFLNFTAVFIWAIK